MRLRPFPAVNSPVQRLYLGISCYFTSPSNADFRPFKWVGKELELEFYVHKGCTSFFLFYYLASSSTDFSSLGTPTLSYCTETALEEYSTTPVLHNVPSLAYSPQSVLCKIRILLESVSNSAIPNFALFLSVCRSLDMSLAYCRVDALRIHALPIQHIK